jgi:hypothetical protein
MVVLDIFSSGGVELLIYISRVIEEKKWILTTFRMLSEHSNVRMVRANGSS